MHDTCKAGEGGTTEYWWWKALTQLRDIIIYHAEDAEALNALDALLTGKATLSSCTQHDAFLLMPQECWTARLESITRGLRC